MTAGSRSISELRQSLASSHGVELNALLTCLADDPRAGVRALVVQTRARIARLDAELERLERLMDVQRALECRGMRIVAGVDEVGRGALAGPVTAGAVILRLDSRIEGLNDSKALSPAARERVALVVRSTSVAWSVAHASPQEIDSIGIGPATRLAWVRAVDGLEVHVDHILVDGNDSRGLPGPSTCVVRGDSSVAAIAAASVIAKVERDSLMVDLAGLHPGYGLEINKGYGAADHMEHLRRTGPSPIHRRSFAPCSDQGRILWPVAP